MPTSLFFSLFKSKIFRFSFRFNSIKFPYHFVCALLNYISLSKYALTLKLYSFHSLRRDLLAFAFFSLWFYLKQLFLLLLKNHYFVTLYYSLILCMCVSLSLSVSVCIYNIWVLNTYLNLYCKYNGNRVGSNTTSAESRIKNIQYNFISDVLFSFCVFGRARARVVHFI